MAKNKAKKETKETTMSEDNTNVDTAAVVAAPEAVPAKKDDRFKILTLKDGSTVKRTDYIRKRWAEKASRSEITKEVSELAGTKIIYQIIFAATKGIPGGPDKVAAPAPAEQPAA